MLLVDELRDFKIGALKIDHSFVSQIGPQGERSEIVRTIVTLAHSPGMEAIAEGIETSAHLEQLKSLGCECGQGFYFSCAAGPRRRPAPAAALRGGAGSGG